MADLVGNHIDGIIVVMASFCYKSRHNFYHLYLEFKIINANNFDVLHTSSEKTKRARSRTSMVLDTTTTNVGHDGRQ